MKRLFAVVVVAVAIALVLLPTAAFAQACGERDELLRQLRAEFGEHPTVIMYSRRGSVIEITASANGSWSVLITGPGGRTCLIDAGEKFMQIPPPTGKPDEEDS